MMRSRTTPAVRGSALVGAAALALAAVTGCNPSHVKVKGDPGITAAARAALEAKACTQLTPSTQKLLAVLAHPPADSDATLASIAQSMQAQSNASAADTLLQQRLQNLADSIGTVRAAWRTHSSNSGDMSIALRDRVIGFGDTCRTHH